METYQAIRTVLAVREYAGNPVAEATVDRILEAARLTASSQNKQPWHFIVVRDKQRIQQLADLSPSGPYIAQAPLAIVVTVAPTPPAVSDASRAIQSMVLAAWSEGVGSNWVGVPKEGTERHAALKELLGVPDGQQFVAILPFGYPAHAGGKGKKNRKPLAEVASSEHYGQPYQG